MKQKEIKALAFGIAIAYGLGAYMLLQHTDHHPTLRKTSLSDVHILISCIWFFVCFAFLCFCSIKQRIKTIAIFGVPITFMGLLFCICHLIGLISITSLTVLYVISFSLFLISIIQFFVMRNRIQEGSMTSIDKKQNEEETDDEEQNYVHPLISLFVIVLLLFMLRSCSSGLSMW